MTSPKFSFGDVEKAMYQVVARHLENNFFFLTRPKCDFGEVEKAMFKGLVCHLQLISFLLTILTDLVEFEKALLLGLA